MDKGVINFLLNMKMHPGLPTFVYLVWEYVTCATFELEIWNFQIPSQ